MHRRRDLDVWCEDVTWNNLYLGTIEEVEGKRLWVIGHELCNKYLLRGIDPQGPELNLTWVVTHGLFTPQKTIVPGTNGPQSLCL